MKQTKKGTSTRTMIEVNGVSVRFRRADDHIRTLKEFAIRSLTNKLHYTEFLALQNVSFEVKKGDVFGIVGRNGAGKSTLLKVISGIMKPTCGTAVSRGNIVPMLELGSGFDFDLSGRENIFLNGAILGYSEELVMRLAFSVAAAVRPEILIVDEILSVGDAGFQEKSRKRMLEMMSGGTTVLFVSHEMAQIRSMCNQAVWLENGQVAACGPAKEICDRYEGIANA